MINAKLLQLVIDASNDGIVVAEQEGEDNILIYVNPAFERMTGYTSLEMLYQDCRLLQGDDRDQPARQRVREAIDQGLACREVLRNHRKDGSFFWNELSITPVHNDSDQLMYYIGIQKDVSSEVEAQQRIVALEQQVVALQQRIVELESPAQPGTV
ncbi:PAS domain-containing protein [Pseudomonas sp. CFBP 8770]|uniref:PAS domain-containing protein n=1 Tax=unclassified Pseudomonas TaxID=196821 RepID=UPI001785932E|nr:MULTISPECIES: PAS domain-containing protein [unclassified Pseudomonas]MBD8474270.1 PAS domain-containing protein [Pseudomonas sp. CFBP 8773]MBD8647400.1 PAS domain-containing protein [Pseudomonas sp. CFBP 8770]